MGNLRDKYTNEEWDEIENKIEKEKQLGKPNENYVSIFVDNLTKEQLIQLKSKLIECHIPEYQYWTIDNWIRYLENKQRELYNN